MTEYERGKQDGVDAAVKIADDQAVKWMLYIAQHSLEDDLGTAIAKETEARNISVLIRRYAMGGPGVKI